MNNCILMAEIIQEPQLRYTSDNQMQVAEMMVEFPGSRPEDPPARLKVVGWGGLAQEIQANFHQGDRVIIEGRLSMNTVDRPEGFKEKRAELTASRIHRIGVDASLTTVTATPVSGTPPAPSAAAPNRTSTSTPAVKPKASEPTTTKAPVYPTGGSDPVDYDEIPF
ncbi:MAG TPA: single-stranded DNA-binding protein [Synechococcales cyanobacterium M55_K2018_004]|nr:single-stranded DNA-binding protein [Synechococcales cyanobacterium M55_K2018_004]